MATFYFNGAVDSNWDTLGNWWTDNNHTIPALALPTSSDSAIISYGIDSGNEPTILNLTVNGAYISTITITVTGNAIFNLGSSLRQSAQLNGNVTFNGASFIDGTNAVVVGDVIFNTGSFNGGYIDGNATFNDNSYNNATIDGNATFNNSSYNNIIDSISGTITVGGIREWEGTWWINNVQTTLRTSPGGVGLWNNSFYRNSVVYAGPSTIYVRTSGNDSNEGTETSPLASAQVAFEMAFVGSSGNKIIDFGVGDFGGIVLSQDWPSRIAVRGVNSSQSLFGGINGNGLDEIYDYDNSTPVSPATNGKNIVIVGQNQNIDLGNITSIGGSTIYDNYNGEAGHGGSVTLTDVKAGDIITTGAVFDWGGDSYGGNVLITDCVVEDIISTGGLSGEGSGDHTGGDVSVVDSTCNNINANGGLQDGDIGEYDEDWWAAGNITVTNSTTGNISAQGSSPNYVSYTGPVGKGGDVTITNSIVENINNSSNGNVSATLNIAGDITIVSSFVDDIMSNAGMGGVGSVTMNTNIVNISNSTCGNITANGYIMDSGFSNGTNGNGSDITVSDSIVVSITCNGGGATNQNNIPGIGGDVTLINSVVDQVTCDGGIVNESGRLHNGDGGTVYLIGSSIIPNNISAGYVDATQLNKGRGINGSSILGMI
jgi:hypothetical protein